jgi:hypothetical protein
VQAAEKYREFKDTQGRTIRGCILAYDEVSGEVRFERDNRRTAKVAIGVFSEADQAYILEWDAAQGFLTDRLLKVTCEKKRVNQRKEEEWGELMYEGGGAAQKELMKETSFESVVYDITLQNKNTSELNHLRMEYIVYYEQSEESWEKPVMEQKIFKDAMSIPLIEGGEKVALSTKPVEVYKDNISQKSWVSGRFRTGGKGDVHGLRARLIMKLPSGNEVTREFTYPDDLSEKEFAWKE